MRRDPPTLRRAAATLALAISGGLLTPATSVGQEVPAAPETAPTTRLPTIRVSPRGAFLRAAVIPGWGHAAIGSYTRGGFYFGAQATTVYTLLRTRARIREARERLSFRENALRAQVAAEGITDPELIDQRLEADESLTDLQGLLDSRSSQQEDLVAFGIFLVLLSGADAYVSAHLARFPEALEMEATPVDLGRVDVGFRLKLPN